MVLELFLQSWDGSSAALLKLLLEEIDGDGNSSFEVHTAGVYLGALLDEIHVEASSGRSPPWTLKIRGEPVGQLREDGTRLAMHVSNDEFWTLANISEAMAVAAAADPVQRMLELGIEVTDIETARLEAAEILRSERQYIEARAAETKAWSSVTILRR